jgi:cellulose synthase/poly-beta-1,6-N-acetylglucosamine synthase-like glycosyltransferase
MRATVSPLERMLPADGSVEESPLSRPSPQWTPIDGRHASGAIVIPAHNEAAVIARTLRSLAPLCESTEVEVIVVCNGCTDETAAIARGVRGVTVLEVAEASKTAAMNAGDEHASG